MPNQFKRHDMSFLGGRRLRRPRQANWSRALVRETVLTPADLVYPIFVSGEKDGKTAIDSLKGQFRHSISSAVDVAKEAKALGIPALAVFPNTQDHLRSEDGAEALNPENLTCQAVSTIREAVPDIGLMTDVALDPYTTHGHDGVMEGETILNDETVEILVEQAVNQARAGSQIIAPSDMMDGRVGAIRRGLDAAGFEDVIILSYAAKYASGFYGPFRDAISSGDRLRGDKLTYQLDFGNGMEAEREVEQDLIEGADMVMVKPGMPYLDIVQRIKDRFNVPLSAYQVSGEYAMIQAAAEMGYMDVEKAMMESLYGFKRAGCDFILTYFALDAARTLTEK